MHFKVICLVCNRKLFHINYNPPALLSKNHQVPLEVVPIVGGLQISDLLPDDQFAFTILYGCPYISMQTLFQGPHEDQSIWMLKS